MNEILMATLGELSLKGLNRHSFEKTLVRTIRKRMEHLGDWTVRTAQSTVYIQPRNDEALAQTGKAYARLGRVFGIAALTRAAVCPKELGSICQTANDYLSAQLAAARTFKVAARRADKDFALNSMDINREVGGWLLERWPHLAVDVHSPELTVVVEVREQAAYVHGGKQRGAGGLPVPSSGRAALLLSGGIDSPVAGWMMARRGLALVAVHFASPPYTSPRAAAKVQALAGILSAWAGPLPYFEVPYTQTQTYLRDNNPKPDYFTVLMRRSMLRIAGRIAQKEECGALVTGESLAQVASQTLEAIACTDQAQSLPVLRPCVGQDKLDITTLARQIGSFETSILPYEDCCTLFTPPHPKTKPKLAEVLACEAALPELAALEEAAAEQAAFRLVQQEDL